MVEINLDKGVYVVLITTINNIKKTSGKMIKLNVDIGGQIKTAYDHLGSTNQKMHPWHSTKNTQGQKTNKQRRDSRKKLKRLRLRKEKLQSSRAVKDISIALFIRRVADRHGSPNWTSDHTPPMIP